jgi:perosamine synthetase
MIPIAKPIIDEDEIKAVIDVLRSGIIAEGQKVKDFEEAFAKFSGTSFAIAVNSGTAALHVALLAHGIGAGDEVITTPFTFVATSNSVLFTGAKPVFADIREDTFNINPDSIIEKITPRTKAIIPVHLYGQAADMKAITEIAQDKDLIIIEDSCQAHGATFEGKSVGSFGEGAFSFYPTKNMTTGEGGMITTNDKKIAEKARMLRSHGSRQRYFHEILGFNLRMTDMAASIGIAQLGKIGDFNRSRIKNAQYLTKSLEKIKGLILPYVDKRCGHVFHQYTVRIRGDLSRDDVVSYLNEKHIGTGIYYSIPIHKQPFYKELGYNDSLPVSESASREVISLPIHPSVNMSDLDTISRTLRKIID